MTLDLSREEMQELLGWASGHQIASPLYRRIKSTLTADVREFTIGDFKEAWERHHKRNAKVFQVVLQLVISKMDQIDWQKFNLNHPVYCEYWNRRGWQYCPEALIDWIDNGCCAPPPEAEREAPNTRTRRIAERRR